MFGSSVFQLLAAPKASSLSRFLLFFSIFQSLFSKGNSLFEVFEATQESPSSYLSLILPASAASISAAQITLNLATILCSSLLSLPLVRVSSIDLRRGSPSASQLYMLLSAMNKSVPISSQIPIPASSSSIKSSSKS